MGGGVTYNSGGADYAEYFPKLNKDDEFLPGHVVGLKNGYVSFDYDNSDYNMVVSIDPVVLGNASEENINNGVPLVFMGQCKVLVEGGGKIGDYLIPSKTHKGMGELISKDLISDLDFEKVIGKCFKIQNFEAFDENFKQVKYIMCDLMIGIDDYKLIQII